MIGSKLYRLNSWGNGVVSGFPKAITDVFRTSRGEELASGVDAALTFYALTKRGRWRLETHLFKVDIVTLRCFTSPCVFINRYVYIDVT